MMILVYAMLDGIRKSFSQFEYVICFSDMVVRVTLRPSQSIMRLENLLSVRGPEFRPAWCMNWSSLGSMHFRCCTCRLTALMHFYRQLTTPFFFIKLPAHHYLYISLAGLERRQGNSVPTPWRGLWLMVASALHWPQLKRPFITLVEVALLSKKNKGS